MPTKAALLVLAEAALERRLTGNVAQEYTIGGQNVRYCTLPELTTLIDRLRNQIAIEAGTTIVTK